MGVQRNRLVLLLVEYWAHEAGLMAVDDWPLLCWADVSAPAWPLGQVISSRPIRSRLTTLWAAIGEL